MANNRFWDRLVPPKSRGTSFLRNVVSGSFFHMSDLRGNDSISDIKTQIDVMRAVARDSQISTALSYYATDATTPNTIGQIIWATSTDNPDIADIINTLFDRWNINNYARDHILELATIGNLYIPTTDMYKKNSSKMTREGVALDANSLIDKKFDIVPSYKIPPEDVIHIWYQGNPEGYIYQPTNESTEYVRFSESAIIHFSLGGLLGDYTIPTRDKDGNEIEFDILFAQPLMDKAVQPTQTLSLLEDAVLLASLSKVVRFINVECGDTSEEVEIQQTLQDLKNVIEQQLSINTNSGDTQSYVNPQSPNNLIFVPRINGQDAISVTDLNITNNDEADDKLLTYYQDKKLSVLGVPKEAMNFSSNEGLGGAGSVLSQRSALYANSLARLETAYKAGWKQAINTYFTSKGLSGYVNKFELHMSPIITTMSTIMSERRDAALSQAQQIVDIMQGLDVTDSDKYVSALTEILTEVLPVTGSDVSEWGITIPEVTEETIPGGMTDEL